MNFDSDIRDLRSLFGSHNVNYLHSQKVWSMSVTDKRGNKVSLFYDSAKPGVIETLNPPKWFRVKVDSFGIGFLNISDLPRFFEPNDTDIWGRKIPPSDGYWGPYKLPR
jgi:hypothetical protein